MCVAFGNDSPRVDFPETKEGAGVMEGGKHALVYGNSIEVIERLPASSGVTPNHALDVAFPKRRQHVAPGGMWLQIPVRPQGGIDLVDTRSVPNLARDLTAPIIAENEPKSLSFGRSTLGVGEVKVLEHMGIYSVVLIRTLDLEQVQMEIDEHVPSNRRPIVDRARLEFYGEMYPVEDWAYVWCCYDPRQVTQRQLALPLVVAYDPTFADMLYLPALDQHDPAKLPDVHAIVNTSHVLALFAHNMRGGMPVSWSDWENRRRDGGAREPLLQNLMSSARSVIGQSYNLPVKNGDWWASVAAVVEGNLDIQRLQPLGFKGNW